MDTPMERPSASVYPIHPEQVDRITHIVSHAFSTDPTWSPFVSPGGHVSDVTSTYWRLFVRSAQRYPWTFMNAEQTATSVWFPPNASELTPEEEEGMRDFATGLFGEDRTRELLDVFDGFDTARPDGSYYYLSLLAVDPAHAGRGLGVKLLQDNLRLIDETGVPSYLESSNPANDAKYMRLGYRPHGEIKLPSGLTLTTFWRDPADATSGIRITERSAR